MRESPKNLKYAEKLTESIFLAASKALKQEYPESDRLAGNLKANINFTNDEIIAAAKAENISSYPSLVSHEVGGILNRFNIPTKEFIKWRAQSFPTNGYTNYPQGRLYLPDNTIHRLVNGNTQTRQTEAMEFGRTLIEGAIRIMGYKISPYEFEQKQAWDFLWGSMLKTEAHDFFSGLEDYLKTKKDRQNFRLARDKVSEFFTLNGIAELKPVFKAVGAKVLFILPRQSLAFPERILGMNFDNAVVRLLAAPAMRRFIALVSEFSQGELQIDQDVMSLDQETSEDENAMLVCDALNLKGRKLFSAYTHSELPVRYERTNNPLVDPFKYATAFKD